MSVVCTLTIFPLTRPASEFQLTRSPTLNLAVIVDLREVRLWRVEPLDAASSTTNASGPVIVFRRRDREANRVGTEESLLIFLKKSSRGRLVLELERGTAVERVRTRTIWLRGTLAGVRDDRAFSSVCRARFQFARSEGVCRRIAAYSTTAPCLDCWASPLRDCSPSGFMAWRRRH